MLYFSFFSDPPEGDIGDNKTYAYLGGNATLIAFTNVNANPYPQFIFWTDPHGGNINNGGRFNKSVLGKLRITNIIENDFGMYMISISNFVGDSLERYVLLTKIGRHIYNYVTSIELSICLVSPGPPQNLTFNNVTDTKVSLTWSSPIQSGDPPYNQYIINIDGNRLNTTTTYITIKGLVPKMIYNASVKAMSSFVNSEEQIAWVTFTTNNGRKCLTYS